MGLRIRDHFSQTDFDAVLTGDQLRYRGSVNIFFKDRDLPPKVYYEENMRERRLGFLEGKKYPETPEGLLLQEYLFLVDRQQDLIGYDEPQQQSTFPWETRQEVSERAKWILENRVLKSIGSKVFLVVSELWFSYFLDAINPAQRMNYQRLENGHVANFRILYPDDPTRRMVSSLRMNTLIISPK